MSDSDATIANALIAGLIREGLTYAGGKLACSACDADGGCYLISHRRECPRHGSLTSYLSLSAVVTIKGPTAAVSCPTRPTSAQAQDGGVSPFYDGLDYIDYIAYHNKPHPKYIGDCNPTVAKLVQRAFD